MESSRQDSFKLAEFNPEEYYLVSDDKRAVNDDKNYVKLKPDGINLVIEYYKYRYGFYPIQIDDLQEAINYIKSDVFKEARDGQTDIRVAFLLTIRNGPYEHSLPFVYIKENGKECILFADSLGGIKEASEVAHQTGIPVIAVNSARQSDYYSCHADAIIFLKNVIQFDSETNQYVISNLLDKLNPRVFDKIDDVNIGLLPDELLTTAQIGEFLDANKEESDRIVHRNVKENKEETLATFLKRHPEAMKLKPNTFPIINGYLREKGFKLANMIEIQFYIIQIYAILQPIWSDELRNEFLSEAKSHFEKMGKHTPENYKTYPGLHKLCETFINRHLLKMNASPAPEELLTKKRKHAEPPDELSKKLKKEETPATEQLKLFGESKINSEEKEDNSSEASTLKKVS